MERLLEALLGVDLSGIREGDSFRVDWTAIGRGGDRLFFLLLVVAALWAAVRWLYRTDARAAPAGARRTLTGLRILVAAGLLAMLLEPVLVTERTEHVPANLVVLRDVSSSMDLKDSYDDHEEALRVAAKLRLDGPAELRSLSRSGIVDRIFDSGLEQLLSGEGDRRVFVHPFGAKMLARDALVDPASADRQFTAVGSAIEQALAMYQGTHLAGILLITDGQSNSGPDPHRAAQGAGKAKVPVGVLAAGTGATLRNAVVTRIDVPPAVFIRDPFEVRVFIEARGLLGDSASLRLARRIDGGPWTEAGSQTVRLPDDAILADATFIDRLEEPAAVEYRATLDELPGELTDADNECTVEIRAMSRQIKVLLVAGLAFPEVQFLINTLMRDPGIQLSSWLMSADPEYQQKGNVALSRAPSTREELFAYDAVILYDPDLDLLPPTFASDLLALVGQEGGGLVYIAGEASTDRLFGRRFAAGDPLLQLLPVYRDPAFFRVRAEARLAATTAWHLAVEPAAVQDPVFRFAGDFEENRRIIASLPPLYWHFPVDREKPGATVLARHSDPRMSNAYGRHVVMATQPFGPGRTFWAGMDSTFRWRFLGEQVYDGFWARVVDRVGRGRILGGSHAFALSTDRAAYAPGSVARISARYRNPDERDAGAGVLHGQIESEDGAVESLTLLPVAESPGLFEADHTLASMGRHVVQVFPGGQAADGARPATLSFQVELPALEFARPSLNMPLLQEMAAATGGAVFRPDQFDRIGDAFARRRVAVTDQRRQELWDAPVLAGAVFLLLFAEWLLRKRHRLL